MILLKDKISVEPGFQFVIDQMELMSAAGRRRMLMQPLVTDAVELEREYDNTGRVIGCLERAECKREVAVVRHQLMQMHDLQGSLANLSQRMVMEEIELFEIKNFAFLCMQTSAAAATLGIDDITALPDLDGVFSLLDPDGTRIPNFYIYDSYHPTWGRCAASSRRARPCWTTARAAMTSAPRCNAKSTTSLSARTPYSSRSWHACRTSWQPSASR